MKTLKAFAALVLAASSYPAAAASIVSPLEDVMTSAFFFPPGTPDAVQGFAGDDRSAFRVSNDSAFGVGPETIYVTFDPADFAGFSNPVRATLSVQSVSGGFGADANATNPFTVSAHGVTADPIASITDDTNPGGPIDWFDFFNNNIQAVDPLAVTAVNGFGTFEFDVSAVVNDWIAGANTVFALALTGKNDSSSGDFLHGFLNNTESPGATFLRVQQLPEPSSVLLVLCGGLAMTWWIVRPSRRTHGII